MNTRGGMLEIVRVKKGRTRQLTDEVNARVSWRVYCKDVRTLVCDMSMFVTVGAVQN